MSKMKKILYLCVTLCVVTSLCAQTAVQPTKKNDGFEKVTNLYLAGKLIDTAYMSMIDSVAASALDNGEFYSISEMSENLKQYEKVAWSKKEYGSYRIDYFTILMNNVYLSGKWGSSIFYAEKIARQSEKENMSRPFIEPGIKMYIYSITNQEDKEIETYEKHKKLIQDLVVKIKKEPEVYYWDGIDALRILAPIINTYFHKKDTVRGEEAYKLAGSLIQGIDKDPTTSNSSRQITKFYTIAFDFFKASGLDRKNDIKAALTKLEILIKKDDLIGDEYAYNLMDWKADYFLQVKQVDSAHFYIDKLEKTVAFAQDQKILINRYKSRLETIKGNPEKAYELLDKALEESFKMQAELSAEMDNLLYAQTEAEHHKLAFEKSEAEKKERNTWIIVISLLLVAVITVSVILLRLKDRKLKKTVKDLDETANIQIALMEQFESEVRKEEQERLSQNLHDDLSGTLAAVKYNIDLQVLDAEKSDKKEKLTQLSEMMNAAFNKVRNKSHDFLKVPNCRMKKCFTVI
ncbi:Histidine kinase [Paenimyroides ummariense]|uniref:Histidine kinase n=1 Tax=Paenimyroides ummariense TaxID=913024 RepID=A0A1I5DNS4_9FLAO|nr:histidine kinase [Paenimyroides ummariense]SFO00807.1 Histidine kinase [Paenimyroides ummariense]